LQNSELGLNADRGASYLDTLLRRQSVRVNGWNIQNDNTVSNFMKISWGVICVIIFLMSASTTVAYQVLDEQLVHELSQRLKNPQERAEALDQLYYGKELLQSRLASELLDLMGQHIPDDQIRTIGLMMASHAPKESFAKLVELTGDAKNETRYWAFHALNYGLLIRHRHAKFDCSELRKRIEKTISDTRESEKTRYEAQLTIGALGGEAKPLVHLLVQTLGSTSESDFTQQAGAANALSLLARLAPESLAKFLPDLLRLLKSPPHKEYYYMEVSLLETIGQMGKSARDGAFALVALADDEKRSKLRVRCIVAVGQIQPRVDSTLRAHLHQWCASAHDGTRIAAAFASLNVGLDEPTAITTLNNAISGQDEPLTLFALDLISKLKKKPLPSLLQSVGDLERNHRTKEVRERAKETLQALDQLNGD
jgi:hypothetical protein